MILSFGCLYYHDYLDKIRQSFGARGGWMVMLGSTACYLQLVLYYSSDLVLLVVEHALYIYEGPHAGSSWFEHTNHLRSRITFVNIV
jgi:hypothetical protein